MSRLRVESFSISLDGYGAGPNQSIDNPLGVGGSALHEWAFATQTFQRMFGNAGGAAGVDDDFAAHGFSNIGAWIMGRNMFGAASMCRRRTPRISFSRVTARAQSHRGLRDAKRHPVLEPIMFKRRRAG
jgi:dihydrofolate reductase